MTGYTRFWNCRVCGERVESIDYPREEDMLCDLHERAREISRAKADAALTGSGFLIDGRRVDPATVTVYTAVSPGIVMKE